MAEETLYLPPKARLRLSRMLGLVTNRTQDAVVACPARNVVFRAAARVGKSWTTAKRHFGWTIIPKTLHWIIAPTYDLGQKEFRYLAEFTQQLARMHGVKKPFQHVRDVPANGDIWFRNWVGSEVVVKSATNRQSLVAEAVHSIMMAEAAQLDEEIWNRYARVRLMNTQGYVTFASTPYQAGRWLYEIEKKALVSSQWRVFHQAAWDADHIDPLEIEQARQDLSEDAFYEQVGGEWRFHGGRVYKLVRPDVQWIEPFAVPASWKIGSATDFGSADPTATLWVALSPTGEGYVIGEYYYRGGRGAHADMRSARQHAHHLREAEHRLGIKDALRIADHHGLGMQLIREFDEAGWRTRPCLSHDRRARRDAAMAALTPKPRAPYHVREQGLVTGDYANLFFFKGRCPELKREMEDLEWREGAREGSSQDTKGDDHAIDCLEYLCEYFNLGVGARARVHRVASYSVVSGDPTGYLAKLKIRTGPPPVLGPKGVCHPRGRVRRREEVVTRGHS